MSYVYKEWKPNNETLMLVHACNLILQEELAGFRVTLRQLYYQLVSKNLLPNTEKAYKRLSTVCGRARLAGLMGFDALEDRGRQPQKHPEFDNLADLVSAAVHSYRRPRWADQDYYAELWVEKDALASVLRPLADEYHVTLMVNKGYSSISAMKESADRFMEKGEGKECILFYLGDLDPSGEDMVRDIEDRLYMFEADILVKKIALTMAQVQEHGPPPNPAKLTDPRAAKFVAQYGDSSWEVDALHPSILAEIIRGAFDAIVDTQKMDAIKAREKYDIEYLEDAVSDLEGADDYEDENK